MKYENARAIKYPPPANPSPPGVACYSVYIPDDDEHRQLFVSALRSLARWDSYARDAAHTGALAAQTWRNALDLLDFEPCGNDCDEEDTLADELGALADGVMSMSQSGGIITALGYAIEAAGEFIWETVLPVVGVTLLAVGAAYVVTLIAGGLTVGSVLIAAGETVELVVSTGAAVSNVIEFTTLVALAA